MAHLEFLKAVNERNVPASMPSSYMSKMRWSKVRAKRRLCGRFLECEANTTKDASFFREKNSSAVLSSNGWIAFFLENFIVRGFFNEFCMPGSVGAISSPGWGKTRSVNAVWINSLVDVPRRKRAFFGFSMSLGSRSSTARFERAFFGFL